MKQIVVLFTLLFCFTYSVAQKVPAKDIVKSALRKMAGNNKLHGYELKITYNEPGATPPELFQKHPMIILIDSLTKSYPDSVKERMRNEMKAGEESLRNETYNFYKGSTELHTADLQSEKKAAITRIRVNSVKGSLDTSRNVYDLKETGALQGFLINNPVWMLQYMASDSAELHYTGTTQIDQREHYIVQVLSGKEWIEVIIDAESQLVSRIIVPRIDNDPLFGNGPERYKVIYVFSGYTTIQGFLLPAYMQEIISKDPFSASRNLEWISLNKPFSKEIFAPEPSDEDKIRFRIAEIDSKLFVMEQTGVINSRCLIRMAEENQIDLFTELVYNEKINSKFRNALTKRFPEFEIRHVFTLESISSTMGIADFFDKKTKMHAPKGLGYLAEEALYSNNIQEDSAWKARVSLGEIATFENEFDLDNVSALILNPNFDPTVDQRKVCYYLKKEKVVYLAANPYSAGSSNKPYPSEYELYKLIQSRNLEVDKIVFSGAYQNNAPLYMEYAEFENRVKAK